MEVPQYSVRPNINRILALKIVTLMILATLMYVAIWFNLQLINISMPLVGNLLVAAALAIAVIIELVRFHVVYSQYKYLFYTNRIIFQKKDKLENFFFKDLNNSSLKRNPLDHLMKTGTIVLNKKFKIGPVNKADKVYEYLLKLVSYYRRTKESHTRAQESNKTFYNQASIKT